MSKIKKNVKYADILALAKEYSEKFEEVKKKQPYHLNIIEELHINENAHSRILAKLLQYKDNEGKYVFLQSLLEYINDKNGSSCDFSKINVVSPEISQEKDRIDVLILDKDNAIIIENKICGAKDQEKQLSRYIKKVEGKKIPQGNIYIVYLTKYYQSPSSDTWSSVREKSAFSARFLNLSYLCDILPWLETQTINLAETECYIKSSLEQYINYLQILKNDNNMVDGLNEFFEADKSFNDLNKLLEFQKKVSDFNDGLIARKRKMIKDEVEKWIPDEEQNMDGKNEVDILVVDVTISGQGYWLYIRLDDNCDTLGCYLEKKDTKNKIPGNQSPVFKEIRKILTTHEDYLLFRDFDGLSEETFNQAKEIFFKIKEMGKK